MSDVFYNSCLSAVLATLMLLVCIGNTLADEPPSWREYQIVSANARFLATVRLDDTLYSARRWEREFRLTVYEIQPDSVRLAEIWSAPFRHSGYDGGMLSDDGSIFVRISFWYHRDSPVVTVNHCDRPIVTVEGHEFGLDTSDLIETVSHQLWLKDGSGDQVAWFLPDGRLGLRTIDDRYHYIDLYEGKLIESYGGRSTRAILPLSLLAFFIGVLLLVIVFFANVFLKRRRRRKLR